MSAKKSKGPHSSGYGNPPVEHQFKPGQSGNPKGRPKGPGNLLKTVAKHASRKVPVMENGIEKKMSKLDVVVSAMFRKASKGDVPAARLLTNLIHGAKELEGEDFQSAYTEADFAVMLEEADFEAKLAKMREVYRDDDS